MRGCGLLRPDEQQHIVSCNRFPNGFGPILAAIDIVLVTPDGNAVRHKVLQEWLQGERVAARIAEEDLDHGDSAMPRVSYRTVVSRSRRAKEGTKVKRPAGMGRAIQFSMSPGCIGCLAPSSYHFRWASPWQSQRVGTICIKRGGPPG